MSQSPAAGTPVGPDEALPGTGEQPRINRPPSDTNPDGSRKTAGVQQPDQRLLEIKNLKTYTSFSLEDLVPEDNFYRQVEHGIDLSFVRDLVRHLYSDFGRPSIDPVVFFKLQLIAYFEGIRSERSLMQTVSLNLAHRWFIGYDLDESVPDHSSLSKIRERYGLVVFQRFFEQIVELCIEAGLVWGEEFFIDATKVRANGRIKPMPICAAVVIHM